MIRFEVRQCYYARSIDDHNCIFAYQVIKRNQKTIILWDRYKEIRCKIFTDDGAEYCFPEGKRLMITLHARAILPGEGQNLFERANILHCADKQIEKLEDVKDIKWENPIEDYKFKKGVHKGIYEDENGNRIELMCIVDPEKSYRSFAFIIDTKFYVSHVGVITDESKATQAAEGIISLFKVHPWSVEFLSFLPV